MRLAAANHAISESPNYDGDEWFTPKEYVDAARKVMGRISLDPASNAAAQEVVMADRYYSKSENGLEMPWFGHVWLNPPYSVPAINKFIAKLVDEYESGNVQSAIVLTNNSSDTSWFHSLISRYPACFTKGRIRFWRPDHKAFGTRQGQTIFYLGKDANRFSEVFSQFGHIVKSVKVLHDR